MPRRTDINRILLLGSGLLMKSLGNLKNLGPGFSSEKLIGFDLSPRFSGYDAQRSKEFYRQLDETLRGLPEVLSTPSAASWPSGCGPIW